jgi:DNA-binding NtrC family response regulator
LNTVIIDDESDICFILGFEFKMKGHQVQTFLSSFEAIEAIEKNGMPDMVICDFKMPKKSGLDFFRWLKQQGYKNPFYILTGELNMDQQLLREEGVTEIFYKPDDLVKMIEKLSR